jgi:universal stress protein E
MSSKPWRSILVAVRDPGGRRQMAIAKAARLAAAAGGRITLFHAFSMAYPLPEPLPTDPRALLDAVARQRRELLQRAAKPLRAAGLRVSCEVVWDYPPAQAIVRQVLASKADLVVAESHRHTRLARWVLANTDWDLIRECPCPVWFVKSEHLARGPLVLAAVDPGHAHAKPSDLDDRLLAAANAVTRALEGRMAMMHVLDVTRLTPPIFLPAPSTEALHPSAPMQAQARAAVARLAKRHGVPGDAVLLREGVPAELISAAAAKLRADVLVMGAVSRSGRDTTFIGNTAEAVLDELGCDALIVKPRGFRTAVSRRRPRLATGKSA